MSGRGLRTLMHGPLPVTAPLVLNPLMARMVEAAGFPAGYLGGGATGYQKVCSRWRTRRSSSGPSPSASGDR